MNLGVMGLTFSLAFLSLLYELVIAQTMSLLAANTAVWYGLTVGIFIGSMGLGAFLAGRPSEDRDPGEFLAGIEVLLALIGGSAVFILYQAHTLVLFLQVKHLFLLGTVIFFSIAFLLIVVVGLLTGFELPVLMELGESKKSQSVSPAQVLSVDYFGILAAGVAFPLLLLPYFSVIQIAFGAGALSALVAVWIVFGWCRQKFSGILVLSIVLAVLYGALGATAPFVEKFFAEKYYFGKMEAGSWKNFFAPNQTVGQVSRIRSTYHLIDIVYFPNSKDPDLAKMINAYRRPDVNGDNRLLGWELFLNGDFQVAADVEALYHETFAHVPVAAMGSIPRRVLILGAGDGLLAREILKYPSVEKVTLVELDREMLRFSREDERLRILNNNAFYDKRLKAVVGDAYDFVRRDRGQYDAVYLDFPNPVDYDLSKLYSSEFYRFVFARLAPDGFLVMDGPGIFVREGESGMITSLLPIYAQTVRSAGFKTVVSFLSELEDDNPAAEDVFGSMYTGVTRITRKDIDRVTGKITEVEIFGEKEIRQEMIRSFTRSMVEGFILASPKANIVLKEELSSEIFLRILNKKRLHLSLSVGSQLDTSGGGSNSVFRPILPRPSNWLKIRAPY